LENNKTMKIKVGTKLVACNEMFIENNKCLTVGNVYEVTQLTDYGFLIIDDEDDEHSFDYSDVPNVWFNLAKTKKDPIVKAVTDKFKQRSKLGINKYGTTLKDNEKDDFLEHLQQELMDATLYIEKIKEQNSTYYTLLGKYNNLKDHCEKLEKRDITTDGIFFKASQLKNLSSEDLLEELHSRNLLLNVTISKSKF